MAWSSPRTPGAIAGELARFSKALCSRAGHLAEARGPFDFAEELRLFVSQLLVRAKHLRKANEHGRAHREDMRQIRLKVAEALTAAAGHLEARIFEDFEGSADRRSAAEAFKDAARLLDAAAIRDFGVDRRKRA